MKLNYGAALLLTSGIPGVFAQLGKLLTITDSQFSIQMSNELSQQIHDWLDAHDTCPASRIKRQDPATSCVSNTVRTLLGSQLIMQTLYASYKASPIPGAYDSIADLPAFASQSVNDAFVGTFMDFINGILANVPDIADIEIQPVQLAALTIAAQRAYQHPDTYTSFSVGRSGQMRLTCPDQDEIQCGSDLCKSVDGATCNAFLSPCPCNDMDCKPPSDSNRPVLDCNTDCGGRDPLTFTCIGLPSDNFAQKGCNCVTLPELDPYIWPDYTAWNTMLSEVGDLPATPSPTPPPSSPATTSCTKQGINDIQNNPDSWKFVSQSTLNDNIEDFCRNQFQALDNANGGSFQYAYQAPPADQTDQRLWDLNYVVLNIYWPDGTTISNDDCENKLKALSADCDWSPNPPETNPNVYNWKWGGEFQDADNGPRYSIAPQSPRARTYQYLFPDQSHGWDIRAANPSDDINKTRIGMNSNGYDLVAMHQCIHGIRGNLGPIFWPQGVECEGLVDFGAGHTSGYVSWFDCWDNTWEWLSWQLNTQGFISGYMEHYGSSTEKCWFGIDPFTPGQLGPGDK